MAFWECMANVSLNETIPVTVLKKLVVNVTYNPLAMTPKLEGKIAAMGKDDADTDSNIQSLMELYSRMIVDWDYEEDGAIIKPTAENLFAIVPSIVTDTVVAGIREHMRPNPASETPSSIG